MCRQCIVSAPERGSVIPGSFYSDPKYPFTTGPKEAAYIIDDLVKPRTVIPSHANEQATSNGKVVSGSRVDSFIKAVKTPVHLPLSGRTMAFDADRICVSGC
ncbi:MAG: hypothetical protein GY703_20270 [Gammaproteobacteria bacterium]|nr:hypothetical protein [Gammaproteobacteria bacterium]